jgi:hypothetical protein
MAFVNMILKRAAIMRFAMGRVLVVCLLVVTVGAAQAGEKADTRTESSRSVAPRATTLPVVDGVYDKSFPLFRILESRRARAMLRRDPTFIQLGLRYRERLNVAMAACAGLATCYIEAARWSDADVKSVDAALRTLCRNAAADCREIARLLRKSGTMIRLHDRADGDLLADAWGLQMGAVARTLAVYGDGVVPRYKDIDSMSHDPTSREFSRQLREALQTTLATDAGKQLFFSDTLQLALQLLAIDGRDEAGRFEPLEVGQKRAAHSPVKRVRWARYPFSVILVPGQGPEQADVRLSPVARQRLEAAVSRFRAHAAPFIIVSGGYVHPARTPFCEAIEMKRALIDDYSIPESAILIDPHARHTTTNLRNAARLMFRYGMPMSKPGLIVSDERQAAYIASDGFDERNRRETGIVPYRSKKLLSALEVEFVPSVEALQVGLEDPLDP